MSGNVIIHNPLCFINERYLKKKVLLSKYESGVPTIIFQDDYPAKIIITFSSNELAQNFVNEFKDAFFESSYE